MASHIYALAVNYNSAGQFCTNVFHYVFDDAGYSTTASAANALITKWRTSAMPSLLAMLPDQVTIMSLKARKATGTGGFEAVQLLSSGNVGTRSGGISASGLNPVLIHFPNDHRKGRGKTFLPGVREADVSAGVFADAFVTAVNTAAPTLFADLVLAGGGAPTAEFVVKSNVAPAGFWSEQTTILSDMLGQQRRRQRPS